MILEGSSIDIATTTNNSAPSPGGVPTPMVGSVVATTTATTTNAVTTSFCHFVEIATDNDVYVRTWVFQFNPIVVKMYDYQNYLDLRLEE